MGRATSKRAPTTAPSPSARLAAVTRPPCASTIWRTIDRPSPELAPKAVPLGRWYESSYPGVYLDTVQIDKEGYVHAPKKPGLGFEIDWKEARKVTVQTIKV